MTRQLPYTFSDKDSNGDEHFDLWAEEIEIAEFEEMEDPEED